MSPPVTYAWRPGISRFSKNAVAFDRDWSNETFKMTSFSEE